MTIAGKLRERRWSPYVVGVALGVTSWFAFATADHGLGITTAFEHLAALVERALFPAWLGDYFTDNTPKIGWETMLVAGVFLGSLLSSTLGRDRAHPAVPMLWQQRFGSSAPVRWAVAFLGGTVMMFGARVAQGCTSGHGITGALQLAVSSWTFIVLAFAAAIATAFTMYGSARKAAGHV
jgi:uncharacterized membrane protein YedE/YeeE